MRPPAILGHVADVFDVTLAELLSRHRYKRLNGPRLALSWALRRVGVGVHEAGRAIDRDHSTVIQNAQAADRRADCDPAFAELLRILAERIGVPLPAPPEPAPAPPVRRPLVVTPQLRLWLWSQRNSIARPTTA